MRIEFNVAQAYYPGLQRVSLLGSKNVLLCLVLFLAMPALKTIFFLFLTDPLWIHFADGSSYMLFVMPLYLLKRRQTSRKAWMLYLAFVIWVFISQYLSNTANNTYAAIAAALSMAFLAMFFKSDPTVLNDFGYTERPGLPKELFFGTISALLFVITIYVALTRANRIYEMQNAARLVIDIRDCIVVYGLFHGIMYGVISRRFLQARVPLPAVILMNVIIMWLWLLPFIFTFKNVSATAWILFIPALLTQLTLGLAYYFCRSTMMVFMAYAVFYLFYQGFSLRAY